MEIIDNSIKKLSNKEISIDKLDDIKDKLKKFRGSGLEKGGEYSYENLVFKFLRRNGYIQKLYDAKIDFIDKSLSIEESFIKNNKIYSH